jgi:hypothetical protein
MRWVGGSGGDAACAVPTPTIMTARKAAATVATTPLARVPHMIRPPRLVDAESNRLRRRTQGSTVVSHRLRQMGPTTA